MRGVRADPSTVRRILLVSAVISLGGCRGDELTFGSTEQLAVSVLPATYNFGTHTVGAMSQLYTVSVTPFGQQSYDQVTAVYESCPDFAFDAPGLPAEVYRECEIIACANAEECPLAAPAPALLPPCQITAYQAYEFSTWFTPSVPGTQSCVVTIQLNGGASTKTVTLSGTGMAPPIDLDVQPGALAFGDVRTNTDSSPANLSIRNLGSGTLDVGSITVDGPYTITGPTVFSLAGGGTQTISVQCQPTAVGSANGSLTITSNDANSPQAIPLSCAGIDSNLGIAPSPAVFPTTRVGEPRSLQIDLVNSGAAPTMLESISLTGAGLVIDSAPAPSTELAGGATASVVVSFDASAHGEATGELTVVTSDGTRTAQLSAIAQTASMSLTPDGEVDFGPVCVGQVASQSFTILGNGDGSFLVTDIMAPAEPFALGAQSFPLAIQGSGTNSEIFTIDATPTSAGPFTSTTTVTTDVPGGEARVIVLNVLGLAEGVTATPLALEMGAQPLDVTTIGAPITLTNCNTAPAMWANARIEGVDATEFAIVAQPAGTTIAATASAEWLIVLTPRSVGPKEAEFVVETDGVTTRVPLTGDGLGDDPTNPGGNGDETSYYACSAGTPTSWIVMLFAIGLVVRIDRRRRSPR